MSETPHPINPEISQTPIQEKVESFSLSKLMECVNELTPRDFEYLESLIKDGEFGSADVAIIQKAVEALQEMKISEDKNSALKKYIPILVDLIYARNIVDGLIGKTGVNPRLGSGIYNLVDAVYEVAPDDVRALANDAVLKIDEEN
jgi:Arc/MetJ-type ribon-helix-helix transcriptional regulator